MYTDEFDVAKKILNGLILEKLELKSSSKYSSGGDKKTFDEFVKFVWNAENWPTLDKQRIVTRAIEYAQKHTQADKAVLSNVLIEMLEKIGDRKISSYSKDASVTDE